MASKINKDKIKPKSHPQDSIPSFIRKTYDILEERKFPEIIDWNPEGTALVIKKPAEFCQKVLPAYFKHNNLTSFVRQLNMYNFHKRRTQNIDHVYYHELFQKGKKSLLKDIKRKNHVHALEKAQKASENLENSQNAKDFSSLAYENQLLKRLYNDAMAKIAVLETQVTDMTQQNQSLWNQAQEGEGVVKTAFAKLEKSGESNHEQISLNLKELTIPPLKLEAEGHVSLQPIWPFAQNTSIVQTSCYLKMKDESGDSTTTEPSHNSPTLHPIGENEKCSDISEVSRIPQQLQLIPQISPFQAQKLASELVISRKETSVGQLLGFWEPENPASEYLYFADQKTEKNYAKFQPTFYEAALLKKRHLDVDSLNKEGLKRHDLCIFSRKNMISTGTEEKDIIGVSLQRESMGNEEYECVDLMDFNQPFCG